MLFELDIKQPLVQPVYEVLNFVSVAFFFFFFANQNNRTLSICE